MADLAWTGALAHLQGLLGQEVVIHVGQGDPLGPVDVLTVHAVLEVGWDLSHADMEELGDSLLFSFLGDQGSGLLLEQAAFLRASVDEDGLTLWTGGVRVLVVCVDEQGVPRASAAE